MRSTSNEGLSAAFTAKDPADFQLRFKDIVSNHEHGQGKFEIFTPELSSKSCMHYRTGAVFAQEKISMRTKFFPRKPIDSRTDGSSNFQTPSSREAPISSPTLVLVLVLVLVLETALHLNSPDWFTIWARRNDNSRSSLQKPRASLKPDERLRRPQPCSSLRLPRPHRPQTREKKLSPSYSAGL